MYILNIIYIKYPILPPKDIIKVLTKYGLKYVSQKGSHMKYSDGTKIVIIPNHSEIPKGTLKSILNQPCIELDSFLKDM